MKSKFKLRTSITVKGVRYRIRKVKKLKNDRGEDIQGLYDPDKKVIRILAGATPKIDRQTFLHELAHAYLYECNIREGLDSQLEEVVIETIVLGFDKHFSINWK